MTLNPYSNHTIAADDELQLTENSEFPLKHPERLSFQKDSLINTFQQNKDYSSPSFDANHTDIMEDEDLGYNSKP